ncbi:MAG TPA: hypothetical protein VFK36_07360, partial [Gemmatimonadales bacterium]|nr:hypothetical protein [Gemmatimonadales bacterium]
RETVERAGETLQKIKLVLDQLVLLRGKQCPRAWFLPVSPRATGQLKQSSAHQAPIKPRASTELPRGDDFSRSMEDGVDSDKS